MKIRRKHLLYFLAFMAFLSSGITKISASSGGFSDSSEKDPKIMVGYAPSVYTKCTGSQIEHIYYLGNHFTRTACVYESFPCCKPTGDKMEGCSAPEVCPNYL